MTKEPVDIDDRKIGSNNPNRLRLDDVCVRRRNEFHTCARHKVFSPRRVDARTTHPQSKIVKVHLRCPLKKNEPWAEALKLRTRTLRILAGRRQRRVIGVNFIVQDANIGEAKRWAPKSAQLDAHGQTEGMAVYAFTVNLFDQVRSWRLTRKGSSGKPKDWTSNLTSSASVR
ncbi:hypothetical protein DFH29DRAFT_1072813 [Suillus ampliporus]|nr:hypothetical protein DFH29DRAFT_1072813 [Suillus ampliporus]